AVALVLRATGLGRLNCFFLAVGFAAVSAILWEFAEYVTFIRFSSELETAYTDTLGDLLLGPLGGTIGAAIVGLTSPPAIAAGAPDAQALAGRQAPGLDHCGQIDALSPGGRAGA